MYLKYPFPAFRGKLRLILALLVLPLLLATGCSGSDTGNTASDKAQKDQDSPQTLRDNTPEVLVPQSPGTSVLGAEPLLADVSNANQGYITVRYSGSAAKANIQITGSDGITYKYFLSPSDTWVSLPLTSGSGAYEIAGYENVTDNKYASLFRESVEVRLENELLPFLYPNQYVFFTPESKAVAKASALVQNSASDLEAVEDIYHFVIENITYDEAKAESVQTGYLPDIDSTLEKKTGICFDYAALTAAMLRSQKIPAKLEIGYSGDIYHAWISVYIKDIGWIDKIIEFTGDAWTRMDPTFAAGNNNSKKILKYIGDGSNYTLQYTR